MRFGLLKFAALLIVIAAFYAAVTSQAADRPADALTLDRAVLGGKDIHVALDLAKCSEAGSGKAGPAIRGSLHPDSFMVQHNQDVAFAVNHFTVRADKTPVNEFMSFRVQQSGNVALHSVFLNAASFAVLHEAEFECKTGEGITFTW